MLKNVDRAFGVLLILAAAGHSVGSLQAYHSTELIWALCASLYAVLLAAINLLRVNRPEDRSLAWIAFAGSAVWVIVALAFNLSIGNAVDPRGLTHAVIAIVLAVFSLRTATGRSTMPFAAMAG
jgi:hypothetical protein